MLENTLQESTRFVRQHLPLIFDEELFGMKRNGLIGDYVRREMKPNESDDENQYVNC